MLETENWVAIAFLCFLGLLAYLGAHRKMIDAIDRRQARIKSELEQARRLREEAQALLGEFQRKGREAETEAQAIMAGAKAEAERLTAEAKSRAEDFVARRTKMAETKISPGRSSSGCRCAFCCSRSRRGRRGENPRHQRQGKNRGRFAGARHCRAQTEIQLI